VPELDGLRGTAILFVLLFHYITQQGPTAPGTLAHDLQRAVIMGWSGVDLFFVLSGFLIGGILMDARSSGNYFKAFYARRFFRIIPIYYFWITVYVAMVVVAGAKIYALSNSGIRPPLDLAVFAHYLFLQNLGFHTFGGIAGAWFGHLWSLAVEEQFYLLAPLVIRLTSPRKLPWLLGVVIVGASVIRSMLLFGVHISPHSVMALMPCRADALALGMLAAVLWRNAEVRASLITNITKLYGLLGILAAGIGVLWLKAPQSGTRGMQTVGYTWLGLFYALLLLLSLSGSGGPIAQCMRIGWLREIGKVSYCIYIIHIVVNVVCHALLLHSSPKITTVKGATVTVLAAFLTYGIAKCSWIMLENPLLRRGHSFKY